MRVVEARRSPHLISSSIVDSIRSIIQIRDGYFWMTTFDGRERGDYPPNRQAVHRSYYPFELGSSTYFVGFHQEVKFACEWNQQLTRMIRYDQYP